MTHPNKLGILSALLKASYRSGKHGFYGVPTLRMLLAGPGTGKTTRITEIVDREFAYARRILVLSFTNATIHDLTGSFANYPQLKCYTLHSYALRINPLTDYYILDNAQEARCLRKLACDMGVDFAFLCRQLKCITFDAMISECLSFLKVNPVYGNDQIGTLDLLIVDEYQDFNATERDLIDTIAGYATETIILGDDDQSIYGFKDADPDGIIQLHKREDVQRLKHEHKCYRCPDTVVACARNLIRHNKNRIDKPWWPTGRPGDCVHRQFRTPEETNEFIVSEIERVKAEDHARGEDASTSFLVLSPVRFYVDGLVQLLRDREIELLDFWAQTISVDDYRHVWWLRAIFSKRRLLNLIFLYRDLTPHFKRKFKDVLVAALQEGFHHSTVLAQIEPMYRSDMATYLKDPPGIEEMAATHPELSELISRLDPDDVDASLDALLKDINPSKEFTPGFVNIMSIHKSKGLQADIVFVTGLVDGVLPNNDTGIGTIEAQRRLLFVGVTRTCKSLYLLSTVEWDGRYVNKVGKSQFLYSWRKKKYQARTSHFVNEMTL